MTAAFAGGFRLKSGGVETRFSQLLAIIKKLWVMPGVFLWLFILMESTAAVGATAAMLTAVGSTAVGSTAVGATFSRDIRFLLPLRGVAFVVELKPFGAG